LKKRKNFVFVKYLINVTPIHIKKFDLINIKNIIFKSKKKKKKKKNIFNIIIGNEKG